MAGFNTMNQITHSIRFGDFRYVFCLTSNPNQVFVELKSDLLVAPITESFALTNHNGAIEALRFEANGIFQAVSLASARQIWTILSQKGWQP